MLAQPSGGPFDPDPADGDTLAAMRAVRLVFDPDGRANPGKVVPTLHRCAEYGRMRVHGGNVRFPELPRF